MAIDYSHQTTGAAFLAARTFAYLGDEPGLGKTRQVIMAADAVGIKRILVLCPATVRQAWEAEFLQWQTIDRPVDIIEGRLSEAPGPGVTVISHAAMSDIPRGRDGRTGSLFWVYRGAPYELVVVDEAHEFRQFAAARTMALFSPEGLCSRAGRVWLVSGTPIVNSAADIYPLVSGALRSSVSWHDFCGHYTTMKPDPYLGVKPTGVRNVEELANGLRPYFLRRTIQSLAVDLPRLNVKQAMLDVNLGDVARLMGDLGDWTPDILQLALNDQKELRDGSISRVRRGLGVVKADPACEYIERILASGEGPVVAFFHHTDVLVDMYRNLSAKCRKVSWIDGSVTAKQLKAAKEWFQAGFLDVLLVQTQAGGQGLTLTRAHRAVIVEIPWTATALEQAIKRIHRIGQKKHCTADVLLTPKCWLDDVMAGVVTSKQRAGDSLLSLLTSHA
jgi:SWI/SNF-related matrix-associated actin-dependent regulator of chromatin subfamily A-like protein 1